MQQSKKEAKNIESECEEIVFIEKEEKNNEKSGNLTRKNRDSTTQNPKAVLSFVMSPSHRTPVKKKSFMVPPQNDSFGNRAIRLFNIANGNERLFEDFFVIGLDKKQLKPGLEQNVSPQIIHTQGFSNQESSTDW